MEVWRASESNVARPCEVVEEWVAVEGGGFQRLAEYMTHVPGPSKTIVKPHREPRASTAASPGETQLAKKPPVKKLAEYFEDHCENTRCAFRPGHAGLCSHQLVTGKRGGRVSRPTIRRPSPVVPPVVYDFLFDLNDSDSE